MEHGLYPGQCARVHVSLKSVSAVLGVMDRSCLFSSSHFQQLIWVSAFAFCFSDCWGRGGSCITSESSRNPTCLSLFSTHYTRLHTLSRHIKVICRPWEPCSGYSNPASCSWIAPLGPGIADEVVAVELPVPAVVLHDSKTGFEFQVSDAGTSKKCKVKSYWYNCISILTTNTFKERIRISTSEITSGDQFVKTD